MVRDRTDESNGRLEQYAGDVRGVGLRALGISLAINVIAGVAAAQEGANAICGTAVAEGLQQTVHMVVGILVLACIVVAGVADGVARMKRDPQEQADVKKWRNSAGVGAVSVPVVMWLIIQVAGFFSIPVVNCVELVPFI